MIRDHDSAFMGLTNCRALVINQHMEVQKKTFGTTVGTEKDEKLRTY